ncbi:two-partner secretion domain-containing protein, partial [Pseudomonas khavaziana]|uniref:two-partner secretion domain-containing protein n=1 Tax=Pseudomonas khavaziana TaxID=2842351 RepID=UPI001C3D163D
MIDFDRLSLCGIFFVLERKFGLSFEWFISILLLSFVFCLFVEILVPMRLLSLLRINFFRRRAARQQVAPSPRLLALLSRLVLVVGVSGANSSTAVEGGHVVAGQATISVGPGATTINQDSSRAAINWNSFNIGHGNKVQFNQPGADSATLNRVIGAGQTTIDGILNANGRVFIVNPNGVVFGKGASVDVGALTATTLGITNEAFMQGDNNLHFSSAGNTVPGFVKVEAGAQITAKSFVALLAENTVSNAGTITAGTDANVAGRGIAMVAGTVASTIHLGSFDVTVDRQSMDALVANSGDLVIGESMADGSILLNATGRNALMRSLLSSSGKITNKSRGAGSLTSLTSGGGLSHLGAIEAAAGKVEMYAPEIAIDGNVTVGDDRTPVPTKVNIGDANTEHVAQGIESVITASSQSHAQINIEAKKVLKLSGELFALPGEISLKSKILDVGLLVPVADKVALSGVEA